jgi:hypothetical protein
MGTCSLHGRRRCVAAGSQPDGWLKHAQVAFTKAATTLGAGRQEEERSVSDCLHCDINEVVRQHIEGKETIDLPDLVAKMAESLVELIMLGPEDGWGQLLAAAIAQIGQVYLEKSGVIEHETTH